MKTTIKDHRTGKTEVFYEDIEGTGGGGDVDVPSPRTPVEDPNTLNSKNILRVIDLLCEGHIQGLVNGAESIYFNEVPLKNDLGDYNFGGVTYEMKLGSSDQAVTGNFTRVESETGVGVTVTKAGGGIIRTINDTDVDDVRVSITIPTLRKVIPETGDIKETSVSMTIDVKPSGGGYSTAKTIEKKGKCVAPYQFSVRVKDLATYGSGPWDIRVTRLTDDDDSTYVNTTFEWTSYTEIKNDKIKYNDSAYIGFEVDAEYFGQQVPNRAYELFGLDEIYIPNNYDADNADTLFTATYSGIWDGTLTTGYSNNPVWILYTFLRNKRWGCGIDEANIDKTSFYNAGYYCDGEVDDGFGGSQRRYTFNYRFEQMNEAFHVLNMIASSFRGMLYQTGGKIYLSIDMPTDSSRLFSEANVEDGIFEYAGVGLDTIHTAARITWFDPDDFYRPAIEVLEDVNGIDRYGYKVINGTAYGCTNRSQAARYGKWILYTELNERETVTFTAGWDAADILPGEVIEVADPNYALVRMGGRVASGSTTDHVNLDNPLTVEVGETYTIRCITTSGTLMESTVNEVPGTYSGIDVSPSLDEAPAANSVWLIEATNVAPRKFRVIAKKEKETNKWEIQALIHDSNKYAEVESGIYFDDPPTSRVPAGALEPPSDLAAEEYTYADGASNQQFGCLLSWDHSPDSRKYFYEVQARNNTEIEPWLKRGETAENWFDIKPVTSGTWDFRVRSVGVTLTSEWVTLSDLVIYADPDALPDITGLQVKGGGTEWTSKDCNIEWDTVSGTTYRFKDYVIEVRDNSTNTLLRTDYTTQPFYTYFYAWNLDDCTEESLGAPQRDLKFNVWARDTYDKKSVNEAVLVATNSAPSMSGLTPNKTALYNGFKVDWSNIAPSDPDLLKYKVYGDTSNPPTTEIAEVSADTTYWNEMGLDTANIYYFQIEPYDEFGVGTKSSVTAGASPTAAPVDIDTELQQSIAWSDSAGTTTTGTYGLNTLYDRTIDAYGPIWTMSGTETWVQASFAIEDYIDRVVISTSSVEGADEQPRGYFALQTFDEAGTNTWRYFAGSTTSGIEHQLTSAGYLTAYATASGAAENYLEIDDPKMTCIFPERQTAVNCRFYMTNEAAITTNVHELVFWREVLGELVVADNLSAISANLGVATAGILQSSTLSSGTGFYLDLDAERMIFGGLADPKLEWNGTNLTLNIDDEASLNIEEGGRILWGDKNGGVFTGDINDSHARIILSEDGATESNGTINEGYDYLLLDNGNIKYNKWDYNSWHTINGLTKVVGGTAPNNSVVNVGYFETQPHIDVKLKDLISYHPTWSQQVERIVVGYEDLTQDQDTGDWSFRAVGKLVANADILTVQDGREGLIETTDNLRMPASTNFYDAIWLPNRGTWNGSAWVSEAYKGRYEVVLVPNGWGSDFAYKTTYIRIFHNGSSDITATITDSNNDTSSRNIPSQGNYVYLNNGGFDHDFSSLRMVSNTPFNVNYIAVDYSSGNYYTDYTYTRTGKYLTFPPSEITNDKYSIWNGSSYTSVLNDSSVYEVKLAQIIYLSYPNCGNEWTNIKFTFTGASTIDMDGWYVNQAGITSGQSITLPYSYAYNTEAIISLTNSTTSFDITKIELYDNVSSTWYDYTYESPDRSVPNISSAFNVDIGSYSSVNKRFESAAIGGGQHQIQLTCSGTWHEVAISGYFSDRVYIMFGRQDDVYMPTLDSIAAKDQNGTNMVCDQVGTPDNTDIRLLNRVDIYKSGSYNTYPEVFIFTHSEPFYIQGISKYIHPFVDPNFFAVTGTIVENEVRTGSFLLSDYTAPFSDYKVTAFNGSEWISTTQSGTANYQVVWWDSSISINNKIRITFTGGSDVRFICEGTDPNPPYNNIFTQNTPIESGDVITVETTNQNYWGIIDFDNTPFTITKVEVFSYARKYFRDITNDNSWSDRTNNISKYNYLENSFSVPVDIGMTVNGGSTQILPDPADDDFYFYLPYNTTKIEAFFEAQVYQGTGIANEWLRKQLNVQLKADGRNYPAGSNTYGNVVPETTDKYNFSLVVNDLWEPTDGYWTAVPGGYSSWEDYFINNPGRDGLRQFYITGVPTTITGATFWTGVQEWEEVWVSNTQSVNINMSVTSNGQGDKVDNSGLIYSTIDYPDIADYPGWQYSNEYRYVINYSYSVSGNSTLNRYASNECWITSGRSALFGVYYTWEGITKQYLFYYERKRGPETWSASVSNQDYVIPWKVDDPYTSFKADAYADYGTGSTASTSFTINSIRKERKFKRPKTAGTDPYAWWKLKSLTYHVGDTELIADGTVSYIAVSQ